MLLRSPKFIKLVQRPLFRNFSTEFSESSPSEPYVHVKHRNQFKKARILHRELLVEEFSKLKNGRNWGDIKPGDSVEVQRLPYKSAPQADTFKGVVIAIRNKFSGSSMDIINCEHGTPIKRTILTYNPLILSIKLLQRAFITNGRKRVKRAKLYYLLDRDPKQYTVK